jgi:multidrug efflux pump subunit AcrB
MSVSADVDEAVASAGKINAELRRAVLPRLMNEFQGLQYRFAGEQRERSESLGSLIPNFGIAMMAIYALLAVQFRSYAQPAIVMAAIPFGIVGATIGHLLMGFNLSILSLFGIVALSGVVVNDSLIMIDLINRERRSGIELGQILRNCATRRFPVPPDHADDPDHILRPLADDCRKEPSGEVSCADGDKPGVWGDVRHVHYAGARAFTIHDS